MSDFPRINNPFFKNKREKVAINYSYSTSRNLPKEWFLTMENLSLNDTTPWFIEQKINEIFHTEILSKGEDEFDNDNISEEFDPASFFIDECSDDEDSNDDEASHRFMEKIPLHQVTHWKHVIYNELVDNHNNPDTNHFCTPYQNRFLNQRGELEDRKGFRFDVSQAPQRRLAELWAQHEKSKKLEDTMLPQIFKEDLYKFYLRACLDLLAKYFIKQDKFTFVYDDVPLFVPNGSLDDALARIKTISARSRKSKKENDDSTEGIAIPKSNKASKKRTHSRSPSKKSKITKYKTKIFSSLKGGHQ